VSAGAEQSAASWHGADQDDVCYGDGGFSQIAAGQRSFVGLGQRQKAIEKAFDPSPLAACGYGQRAR
jgi:hypothetical protein